MPEDLQEKTEDPTPKKLEEARHKGMVAKSHDLTVSLMLLFSLGFFFFFAGYMFRQVAQLIASIFTNLLIPFDNIPAIQKGMWIGVLGFMHILLPLFLFVLFIAVACNVLQTGFLFSFYPLAPKWNKLSVFNLSNYEHLFSWRALTKLGFALLRVNLVVVLSFIIVGMDLFRIYRLTGGDAKDMVQFIYYKSMMVGFSISVAYIFVGIADLFYEKWNFRKRMRMTKREVRDEQKQMEGDLKVKSKIHSIMQTFAQQEIERLIPYADIGIASGNECFVALKYREKDMRAPICLAKGMHQRAEALRALMQKYRKPIIENPPLARALIRKAPLKGFIPPELYKDVAETLVHNLRKK